MANYVKKKCRVCGQLYIEDLITIDTLVTEKREELDRIYHDFNKTGRCKCPLCKPQQPKGDSEYEI